MPSLYSLRRVLVMVALTTTVFAQQNSPGDKKREKFPPGEKLLWMDPGDVASLDFQYGIGGMEQEPKPPFHFVNEDQSGSTPKINVTDSNGTSWNLKWGHEATPSTFCTRLAWACGYFAEAEYFVRQGQIEGAHGLIRASCCVSKDGSFEDARFQLRSGPNKYLKSYHWTWDKNPFVGSHELQGLKILTLLVSNMDAKNVNLGVFQNEEASPLRYLFATVDLGGSLGKWGNVITRTIGDCKGFESQTPNLVKGVENGRVRFTFSGKHSDLLVEDVSVADVQWLMQYLGQVTDEQIRTGLSASGATPEDTECYARSLRNRIEQLQRAAATSPGQTTSQ
jgi:hypothetical protein